MTRLSPSVTRTVAVLNFFADHPGQAFTLTDLVRALRLSRATCHSILAALTEADYLYRNPDKSYMLGPALARLAAAAQSDVRPLQVAIPEMRQLADALDVICSAIFLENGEAVVRERASSLSHIGWAAQLGRRFPLQPPFGSIFMAWNAADEIEHWLMRAEPVTDLGTRADALASLEFPRRHGFSFGLRTEHLQGQIHAQSLTSREDKTIYLVEDLRDENRYDLAFVVAPVFDAQGRVAFALALMGFTAAVRGDEVARIGASLREACNRVSNYIGGEIPQMVATDIH
jgi:DNA-binding IclR family transcriptional regulator